MKEQVLRKLFLGFIQLHILHHASIEPIYGTWMMDELKHHGYSMSAGTLYPLLHHMEESGLLTMENRNVEGKIRKYYQITEFGLEVLKEGKMKAAEFFKEMK